MNPTRYALLMTLLAVLCLPACQQQGPFEEAGENIDEAVEDTKDAVDDACEDVKEAVGAEDEDC
jgi:outer membrane lipoprotein-sorting protein